MKGTTLSDLQSRNQDTLLDFQFSDVASGIKKVCISLLQIARNDWLYF